MFAAREDRDTEWNAQQDLSQRFDQAKRKAAQAGRPVIPSISCPFCTGGPVQPDWESLFSHVRKTHPEQVPESQNEQEYGQFMRALKQKATGGGLQRRSGREDTPNSKVPKDLGQLNPDSYERHGNFSPSPAVTDTRVQDISASREDVHLAPISSLAAASKKRALGSGQSPTSSVHSGPQDDLQGEPARRPEPTSKRLFEPESKGPPFSSNQDSPRRSSQKVDEQRKGHRPRATTNVAPGTIPISALPGGVTRQQNQPSPSATSASATNSYLRQPETRPISQEQLVAEVKGIYAGLVMVEGKCIQVDAKQAQLARDAPEGQIPKLTDDQWQALIALHRTLLHEHHDFFLASQHPSATPAVRKLALKYAMPARLWRHAIHSFLELLRNRLPDSLDHMLAFIYLAYSMMTLLYETVDVFEETWIECLGDLGRYRMAIEDDDVRDREVWTQVSRQWYLKASGKNPQIGRLYHHLAILARPNAFQQLFYYTKSLSVSQPFPAAKESILTLFEPVLKGKQARKMTPVTIAYIKAHAILFMGNTMEGFGEASSEFVGLLDSHISRCTQRFLEMGYLIAIANCLALLAYGSASSILAKALSGAEETVRDTDVEMRDAAAQVRPSEATKFANARDLFVQSLDINCQRVGDPNILSFIHVTMIFMVHLSRSPAALQLLSEHFPWASLVTMLNGLARFYHTYPRIENDDIPIPEKNDARPTPEEFALRGLDFAEFYFPAGWFENPNIEDENMYKEDPSMNTEYRPERILWLGRQLANRCREITYVSTEHKFVVSAASKSGPSTTKVTHETDSEMDSAADSATLAADSDVMSPGSSMDYQASIRPIVGSDTHEDDRMDTEEHSARDSGE